MDRPSGSQTSIGGGGNAACVADSTMLQKVIDSLDNFIGNARDANARKLHLINRIFGEEAGNPCTEPKSPTPPGLQGELSVRLDTLQRILGDSHHLLDRLNRLA